MPPVDHELNLTMQAVLTDVSWGLTAVLLVIAIESGFLYVRRRVRRVLRKGAHAAAVVSGLGAVAAGVGSLGVAAAAAAWYRRRAKRSAALTPLSDSASWGTNGAGAPSATTVDPSWSGEPVKDSGPGPSGQEVG